MTEPIRWIENTIYFIVIERLSSYKIVFSSCVDVRVVKETVCKTVISSVRFLLHTLYIKFNSMDEEEIFEDQVADYWIDYYKTVE